MATFVLKSGRDWRVDTLRGYFLVMMTVAHLPNNPLRVVTEYVLGYASAPDGFVFLSGLVSGWVYLKIYVRNGLPAIQHRALRRARDIYLVHLSLLAFAIIVGVLGKNTSFLAQHPWQALAGGALLVYQPSFSDILPMYCVFLLFLPLLVTQLMKGRMRLIVSVSTALWLLSQFGIGDASTLVPWIYLGTFNLLAWQAYFVAGGCFAYLTSTVSDEPIPKSEVVLAMCQVFAILFFLDRHLHAFTALQPRLRFSGGPDHNPVRFVDAACLGYLIYWIPRTVDERLKQFRLFRFLNLLGQHSLQVYAFSTFATFIAMALSDHWLGLSGLARAIFVIVVVLSLAIPARVHEHFRRRIKTGALAPVHS